MDADRRRRWEERHRAERVIEAPSPFVVRALACLDGAELPATPRALDLACGRGRHALLLADRGYSVEAVDYAPAALLTLQAAARARALPIACIAADVTTWPLPAARYALVVVVNFLERGLFPTLRACVAPGGALLYETHRGTDAAGAPHGVRPDFTLAPGELDELCHDWSVLLRHDDVALHDGRPVARAGILARRPANARAITGAH